MGSKGKRRSSFAQANEARRRALIRRLQPFVGTEAPSEEGFLSVGDVALLMGVTPHTVRRWVDTGILTAYRTLGGHRLVPVPAVREALQRMAPHRDEGTPPAAPAPSARRRGR